ncbi:MAG: electron transfer flavoprotein subunit beta [Hyperthermus sp.]|nr:MAG: electron transfer flavoprotein subunit beta [Hyperthermus sp.]
MALRIAVLVKASLDPNMLRSKNNGLLDEHAMPLALSEYDKNAVEAAVQLRERNGGSVTVLSVLTWGPVARRLREFEQVIREALAMGADDAHIIVDDALVPGDPASTAEALAALAKALGGFDIYIAGEASMDMISGQVPARLAALLNLPYIGYARSIEIANGAIRAKRDLEGYIEHVEAPLPCVVSVTGEINKPRIPTLIQVRRAFRKPIKRYSVADIGLNKVYKPLISEIRVISVKRRNIVIEGDNMDDIAAKLADIIAGLLPR